MITLITLKFKLMNQKLVFQATLFDEAQFAL